VAFCDPCVRSLEGNRCTSPYPSPLTRGGMKSSALAGLRKDSLRGVPLCPASAGSSPIGRGSRVSAKGSHRHPERSEGSHATDGWGQADGWISTISGVRFFAALRMTERRAGDGCAFCEPCARLLEGKRCTSPWPSPLTRGAEEEMVARMESAHHDRRGGRLHYAFIALLRTRDVYPPAPARGVRGLAQSPVCIRGVCRI